MFRRKKVDTSALTAELEQEKTEREKLAQELSTVKEELEDIKSNLSSEKSHAISLENKNKTLSSKVKELEVSLKDERDRIKELHKSIESLKVSHSEEISELQEKLVLSGNESKEGNELVASLEEEIEALKLQLSFVNESHEEKNSEEETLSSKLKETEKENKDLLQQVFDLQEQLRKGNHKSSQLSFNRKSNDDEAIQGLQEELNKKNKELVELGEKNFKLSDKLQQFKKTASSAEEELEKIRDLLIRDIAGEETDSNKYKNIPLKELLRLKEKTYTYARQSQGKAAIVALEAQNLKYSEENKDDEECKDGTSDAKMKNMYSPSKFLEMEAELRLLRKNNKQLQTKAHNLESVGRSGQAATEAMENLQRKNMELVQRFRTEKDAKKKVEQELDKSNDRVKALSEHIEKLMIHLKHEAAAKLKAIDQQKQHRNENELLKQKANILVKKNKAREKMMLELREGSRILEDQLRLMDQKYVDLRTKLDWTRVSSNREVKKIQKEANKLRVKFSLALANGSNSDYINSATHDLGQLSRNQSIGGMTLLSEQDQNNQSSEKNMHHSTSSPSIPGTAGTSIISSLGRTTSAYSSATGISNGELPAIESIIQGERYRPRE